MDADDELDADDFARADIAPKIRKLKAQYDHAAAKADLRKAASAGGARRPPPALAPTPLGAVSAPSRPETSTIALPLPSPPTPLLPPQSLPITTPLPAMLLPLPSTTAMFTKYLLFPLLHSVSIHNPNTISNSSTFV